MDRIILIGSVTSSLKTLSKLFEHKMNVIAVFGLDKKYSRNVSGYSDLKSFTEAHTKIPFHGFKNINDQKQINALKEYKPDIIFAVGISQILSPEILNIPSKGIIGFHPTQLPKGRGRAPIAWLILDEEEYGSATFFLIKDGVDNGPIFVQKKFPIEKNDDAFTVYNRLLQTIDLALDEWLPNLKKGKWEPLPQNENLASYNGKRTKLDGIINWYNSAKSIDRLIKASTKPHPGALTFYGNNKIIIWESAVEKNKKIKGVVGRVLEKDGDRLLVQTGSGLLWINNYRIESEEENEPVKEPVVGSLLGYYNQYEIYKLKHKLAKLEKRLDELTKNE